LLFVLAQTRQRGPNPNDKKGEKNIRGAERVLARPPGDQAG
jgi:hypothetical protein